jgi:hypothetical protein
MLGGRGQDALLRVQAADKEIEMTDHDRPSDLVRDGCPAPPSARSRPYDGGDDEEAMKDVVDPELMVNVVDLGLVCGSTSTTTSTPRST